jgi:hypothetical protein
MIRSRTAPSRPDGMSVVGGADLVGVFGDRLRDCITVSERCHEECGSAGIALEPFDTHGVLRWCGVRHSASHVHQSMSLRPQDEDQMLATLCYGCVTGYHGRIRRSAYLCVPWYLEAHGQPRAHGRGC